MKFSSRLLLPALIGAASAVSDASVYLLQGQDWPSPSDPSTLTPEEARLVFAQRLGVSRYHGIGEASESALAHINTFGGYHESIFQDSRRDKASELLILVQGVSTKNVEPFLSAWSTIKPAFTISNFPSSKSNQKFIEDLQRQVGQGKGCVLEDDVNPFNHRCWNEQRTKAIYLDLKSAGDAMTDLVAVQQRLLDFAKNNEMNVMVALMPETGSAKSPKPYGSYQMPAQAPISRRQAEEPMTDVTKESSTSNTSAPFEPITGIPPVCHSSLEACTNTTNNCSGHGECYKKYGPASGEDAGPSCYTCGCVPTQFNFTVGEGKRPATGEVYWGGSACQKQDVSGPFWLFAGFTVVMIGLISWAIGMIFSIGEEKLPGVIGAGVSSKSR